VGLCSAESDTVSRRMMVKSPAWNSVEGSPKCFLNRARAAGNDVSATPMSWLPGRDAIYGVSGFSGNTFRKRRYSASHLESANLDAGRGTFYRPTLDHHP
jgi:hypothetical protein